MGKRHLAQHYHCARYWVLGIGFVLLFGATRSGICWTSPQVLNTTSPLGVRFDSSLNLATDGAGVWEAVWCSNAPIGIDYGVLHSRSTNNGLSWSAPAKLSADTTSPAALSDAAVIAPGGGNVWVCAWSSESATPGESDILACRSADGGATWSPAAAVTGSGVNRNYLPVLDSDRAGTWIMAWETSDLTSTTVGQDGDIMFCRSADNGVSWSTPAPLNTDAGVDTRIDGSVSLATDRAGRWIAVWQGANAYTNPYGTDSEIFFSRSLDNGLTWSAPQPLNVYALVDGGYDWNASIASDGTGNWVTAWVTNNSPAGVAGTDDDILFARSTDNGTTWSTPGYINTLGASDTRNDGDVSLSYGSGRFVAVWASNERVAGGFGADRDVLYGQSTSGGASWGVSSFVNTNAASDSTNDRLPGIAIDGSDHMAAAWVTGDNFDGDMLYATQTGGTSAVRDWSMY
jgi:hypothetical protein